MKAEMLKWSQEMELQGEIFQSLTWAKSLIFSGLQTNCLYTETHVFLQIGPF